MELSELRKQKIAAKYETIVAAIQKTQGHRGKAAALLNMPIRTFNARIARYHKVFCSKH